MRRNGCDGNLPNITARRDAKIFCVEVLQFGIRFAGENATMPQLLKHRVEAAKTSKQIDSLKPIIRRFLSPRWV